MSDSLSQISPFDCSVVSSDGENVTVQICVPVSFLNLLPGLFNSMSDFSRLLRTRAHVSAAVARASDSKIQEQLTEDRERFFNLILSRFDSFVASGETPRQAIRSTRESLRKSGYDVGCYVVELVARNAGRLSVRKNKNVSIVTPA